MFTLLLQKLTPAPPNSQPTMLESFSRTLRTYVPSSIPIPTAAPSPPLVSRPLSFGSFMTGARTGFSPERGTGRDLGSDDDDDGFALGMGGTRAGVMAYPRTDVGDVILWARWDSLGPRSVVTSITTTKPH